MTAPKVHEWAILDDHKHLMKGNKPETFEFFTLGESVVYFVKKDGAKHPKAFVSAGPMPVKVGSRVHATGDQSRRNLGTNTIIGVRKADGTTEGEIPEAWLAAGVLK